MTGIDVLTAAPLTIQVAGRSLRFSPLTIADIGRMQAWVNAQLLAGRPDPIAIARQLTEGCPPEVQTALLERAYRDAREEREVRSTAPFGTPAAAAIIGTPAGIREVLALSLAKYQPELTRDDVATLLGSLLPGDFGLIFGHVFGTEGAPDPKAPEAVAGSTASTGATSTVASASSPTASTPTPSGG